MLATTEGERPIVLLRDAWLLDLGRKGYREVWELQKALVDRRAEDRIPDGLILVEHDPVATLGRRGKREDVLDPGLEVFEIERGGEATYHGPGQLVGYPVVRLGPGRRDIRRYVHDLEQVLIDSLADFGIDAERHPEHRGVWIEGRKIASLGIRISRWVTSHGFALNVSTDLSYFSLMNPCGIAGCRMTSLELECAAPVPMAAVRERVTAHFGNVFACDMHEESIAGVH